MGRKLPPKLGGVAKGFLSWYEWGGFEYYRVLVGPEMSAATSWRRRLFAGIIVVSLPMMVVFGLVGWILTFYLPLSEDPEPWLLSINKALNVTLGVLLAMLLNLIPGVWCLKILEECGVDIDKAG